MQAIILAGGRGTRLRPYTTIFPKPLMPVGDYPILEIIIRQLNYYGFKDMTFAVGHLKELLEAYFYNGEKWGVNIKYSNENVPLGTAAPLKLIDKFEEDFLVMNGDVLTNINFSELFEFHKNSGAVCTIATYKKEVKIDLGVIKVNECRELTDYIEKPEMNYFVSMGVYIFNRSALDYIPQDKYFDFPNLIHELLASNKKICSYMFDGRWLDIGRVEDYEKAIEIFENTKSEFLR